MALLNSKIHGVFDYANAAILFVSPWIFGFENNSIAAATVMICGALIFSLSWFTNYELGVQKMIDFPVNRNVDIITGLFIASSPWLLSFNHYVSDPHLTMGLLLAITGSVSSHRAYTSNLSRPVHH
jgi:hypothetical protein